MKKYSLIAVFILIAVSSLLSGCSNTKFEIYGEYEFENIIYVGGISSSTIDALEKSSKEKKYFIENDSFRISEGDRDILFSNVKYEEEILDKKLIGETYSEIDEMLMDFFNKYEMRFKYNIYNEQGKKINYCIYLMDDEIFISKFAKKENIIFSIDKVIKID